MIDPPLHRFSAFVDLTAREQAVMRDMIGQGSSFDAGRHLCVEGDETNSLFFLHDGWVLSTINHPNGNRQALKAHQPGDVMGAPSMPFETAVESLIALTPIRVSEIPLSKIGALFATQPRLAALLHLGSQEERVTLMDRMTVGGQLSAKHSVASLLLLLFDGRPPSDSSATKLHIPLVQDQIADLLGLSTVHVNRVIVALEAEGLIRREGNFLHTYQLTDVPRLKEFVGMPQRMRRRNPAWLPLATE